MTSLRPRYESAISLSSSWTDTDCESDSDAEEPRFQPKMKTPGSLRVSRTAPILIPQSARRRPAADSQGASGSPDLSFHESERLAHAGRFLGLAGELDEDDPAFYGNLAFFRSQRGAQRMTRGAASSASASCSSSLEDAGADQDDEIFDMEL